MPLSELAELLEYAKKRETEKQTIPLWIAHVAIQKMTGGDVMEYDDFISAQTPTKTASNKKSPDAIIAEFDAIVAADKAQNK
jgi:hypothetical protein